MSGLDRARADLARGDARKARDRLKGVIGGHPENLEARALLAEAYRRDRQWPEAGRWGYLMGAAASDAERRAFEEHAAFDWSQRITESRLRHLLHNDDLAAIADDDGRALLRSLPRRRNRRRSDGPVASLVRGVARLRAWVAWR